jgi:outer membrane lipoprotein-sorting protein
MMFAPLVGSVVFGAFQSKDIEAYCQAGLRDLAFSGKVVKAKPGEAAKIDNDYRRNLSFQNFTVAAKEPFKLRIEVSTDDTKVIYVVNGTTQLMRIPKMKISQKVSLAEEPGRRQTFFDFGILTPSLVKSYFISKFVRFDRESGDAVFDLTWPITHDTSRHRVWIDRTQKFIKKREWYSQTGTQKATIFYTNPVSVSGVTFPTTQQVFNIENKLAGEFKYTGVKVNEGLAESLFSI